SLSSNLVRSRSRPDTGGVVVGTACTGDAWHRARRLRRSAGAGRVMWRTFVGRTPGATDPGAWKTHRGQTPCPPHQDTPRPPLILPKPVLVMPIFPFPTISAPAGPGEGPPRRAERSGYR